MARRVERAVHGHARVVTEHVHAAELAEGAIGQGLHGGELGHVRLDGDRLGPRLGDAASRLCHPRVIDVGDHDARALAGKGEAEGAPDAAGAARDDGGPVLETFHGISRMRGRAESHATDG